jgi:hypothetical protein
MDLGMANIYKRNPKDFTGSAVTLQGVALAIPILSFLICCKPHIAFKVFREMVLSQGHG